MKIRSLRCNELAIGSNGNCSQKFEEATEEELYRKIIEHARDEHDLRHEDLTRQLEEQIRGLINLANDKPPEI
jgi:predicted small metal-binding protein